MDNLYIPGQVGSFPTPTADFDASTGLLVLTGESHPEDPAAFYAPLLLWLDSLTAGPLRSLTLELRLSFFSASTRAQLLALLQRLHAFASRGASVRVSWQIDPEDEDMVDTAADFESTSGLPIRIVRTSLPIPEMPVHELGR